MLFDRYLPILRPHVDVTVGSEIAIELEIAFAVLAGTARGYFPELEKARGAA